MGGALSFVEMFVDYGLRAQSGETNGRYRPTGGIARKSDLAGCGFDLQAGPLFLSQMNFNLFKFLLLPGTLL